LVSSPAASANNVLAIESLTYFTKSLYSELVTSVSSIKNEETVTVFRGAFSGVAVKSASACPITKEPPGMATIPKGLCATKDFLLSFGTNSPLESGFPELALPPPLEHETTKDAASIKRNILFIILL